MMLQATLKMPAAVAPAYIAASTVWATRQTNKPTKTVVVVVVVALAVGIIEHWSMTRQTQQQQHHQAWAEHFYNYY